MALLRNTAVLEIDGYGGTGVFEFSDEFELTRAGQRQFIAGQRGEYVKQVWDQTADVTSLPETGAEKRTAFYIDGGAGDFQRTLTFQTGGEPSGINWGDGDGGTGPSNVTQTDASGANVNKEDRADILEHWLSTVRIDSENPARLYYNQYSDGTYGDAGAYSPLKVTIPEFSIETDTDNPSTVTGTLTAIRIAELPSNLSGDAREALNDISDF